MPASRPQRRDPRRVQLGAAGLGVVEVAPGEDRDPAQPRGRGDVAELADDVRSASATSVGPRGRITVARDVCTQAPSSGPGRVGESTARSPPRPGSLGPNTAAAAVRCRLGPANAMRRGTRRSREAHRRAPDGGRHARLAARAPRRRVPRGARPARPGRRGRRRLRRRRRDRAARRRPTASWSASTTAPQTVAAAATTYATAPATPGRCGSPRRRRRARAARRQRRLRRARRTSSSTSRTRRCTSPSSPASLRPDGTAFVITPNAPADFENPFHVYLFEPEHLVSLLALFFDDVHVLGLEGDDVLHADFAARRASGERLLKLDVLRPAPADAAPRRTCGRTNTCCRSCTSVLGQRAAGHRLRASTRRTSSLTDDDRSPTRRCCSPIARAAPRPSVGR